MAGLKDVVGHQLETGNFLLGKFTGDLSDAEYFIPAVEGGNHAAWILGHIAVSEDLMVSLITGSPKRLPEPMHELFRGGSACVADASKYPSRSKIDDLLRTARTNTLAALAAFDEGKSNDPSPERPAKDFFPTMGSLWGMIGAHQFWHIGQLTDCRRVLKKPPVLQM